MTDVGKLISDWETNLAHAREVCEEAPKSEECEVAWEAAKELDIHFEHANETLSPKAAQA
ncbi:MAG: hypothetical protein H7Y22_04135 [Gemmatimonadaceae bacterium]|nr:hypothetical protein [Gloeobacterales cyanobacterium ES-bin-141]